MNDENLIPFSKRSESEQRAIRSKGGKASGRVRSMKSIARKLVSTNVTDDEILKLLEMFEIEEKDFKTVMVFMQMLKAAKNADTEAFKVVQQLLGEDVKSKELKLKKEELKLKKQKECPDTENKELNNLFKVIEEELDDVSKAKP